MRSVHYRLALFNLRWKRYRSHFGRPMETKLCSGIFSVWMKFGIVYWDVSYL